MFQTLKMPSNMLVKVIYYALVVTVLLGTLYCVWLLVMPLIASVLLTFLVSPVVNWFESRGVRRLTILLALYLLVTLIAALGLYLLVPALVTEIQTIARDLPHYRELVFGGIASLQTTLHQQFPHWNIPDFQLMATKWISSGQGMDPENIASFSSGFFSVLSAVVIVPVATFFFLLDGHLIQRAILRMVPNRYFEIVVLLFHKITQAIRMFIRGQLIDALAVGVMTGTGLSIIGMPYAIIIGVVAGLGNLIPYLGPFIGAIPAVLILFMTPGLFTVGYAIAIVCVFIAVQFIEGTFIYPFAVGKSVNLHPLVVILGVTVGGQLGGIIGMLVVIPIISILKVSVEVLYVNLKSYGII